MVAAFATLGCASVNAPVGFLPSPEEAAQVVHGGWIDVIRNADTGVRALSGELLAITHDSLWILGPDGAGYVVPRRGVAGKLGLYNPELGKTLANTLLGTVFTISNGFVLILTAPAWWLTGTFGGMADATTAIKELEDDPPDSKTPLAAFARYPQGMPRGMDAAYTRLRP
jgi:hypothetical protein